MAAFGQHSKLDMKRINDLRRTFPVDFQSDHNFNPFKYWKGKENEAKLSKWQRAIDDIVDQILNVYTKGFNTATSSFSNILLRFSSTQEKVDKLAENLNESRKILEKEPDNLREMHLKNKRLEKILDILAKVQYVVGVPKQVDQFVARKQYLHAVELVLSTLSMLLARDLNSFGALEEVRQSILNQKNLIQEQLIDHLHHHIYNNTNEGVGTSSDPVSRYGSLAEAMGDSLRQVNSREGSWRAGMDEKAVPEEKNQSLGNPPATTKMLNGSFRASSSQRYFEPPGFERFSPFRNVMDSDEKAQDRVSGLLREEKSDTYLANPFGNSKLLVNIVVESMTKLGRLASCEAALKNRVDKELTKIIDAETEKLQAQYRQSQNDSLFNTLHSRTIDPWERVMSHNGRGSEREAIDKSEQRLTELMNVVFSSFTRILQNHIEVWSVLRAKHEEKTRAIQKENKERLRQSQSEMENEMLFGSILRIQDSDLMRPKHLRARPKSMKEQTQLDAWFVWEAMQTQLKDMLCKYWMVKQASAALEESKKSSFPANDLKLDFRFEFSDIPSVAALAREHPTTHRKVENKGQSKQKSEPEWIVASPYHVTSCYRRVVTFIDQGHSMVDDSVTSVDSSTLRNFMNNFIRQQFIPRVQADTAKMMTRILCDTAAFKPIETDGRFTEDNERDFKPPVLVHSSMRFADLVSNLMRDMLSLPHSVNEYLRVVERCCQRFLQHCEEKFTQQLPSKLYSAQILGDRNFLDICRLDKRTQRLFGVRRGHERKQLSSFGVFKAESQHFYILYMQHIMLTREQLLWDTWEPIALLCESMHWVSRTVRGLSIPGALKKKQSIFKGEISEVGMGFVERPRTTARSFISRKQYRSNSGVDSVRMSFRKKVHKKKPSAKPGIVESKTISIADSYRSLAEKCLFTMRVEVQMHCFFHLSAMLHAEYALKDESLQPEDFIVALNQDLIAIEDAISTCLGPLKVQYVFADLDHLVCSIIMRTLPLIAHRRITHFGVLQITRNIYALQQNLTNFVHNSTAHFDRARRYFGLLEKSLEDLEQFRAENPREFTQEEYKAIIDAYETNKAIDNSKMR